MMDTPICDFVRQYHQAQVLRLHMPGHKGVGMLGVEHLDITEVSGADSLYDPDGIIRQSEENASRLFGCPTYYSTEGASHCIRAMLHLATVGKLPAVAAARNVHKAFLTAAALLELQVRWIYPEGEEGYLSCQVSPEEVDRFLKENRVSALYITSPDYLGNMADIQGLSQVCRRHGVLLLVDNAHGAYLRFLRPSRHPMDLGADMCCSSAHKTLPVLTGGAYLHVGDFCRGNDLVGLPPALRATPLINAGGKGCLKPSTPVCATLRNDSIIGGDCHGLCPRNDREIRNALALFGSTSPSYLILQSLDMANRILSEGYEKALGEFVSRLYELKEGLLERGWQLVGEDPLRLTVRTKPLGYTGVELSEILRQKGMECEFADPDYLVMMLSPDNGLDAIRRLERMLREIPVKSAIRDMPPGICSGEPVLSIRQAMLARAERLPVEKCLGRVLAQPSVGCPPAVPIVICGERIGQDALECFRYYGVTHCSVVDEV